MGIKESLRRAGEGESAPGTVRQFPRLIAYEALRLVVRPGVRARLATAGAL